MDELSDALEFFEPVVRDSAPDLSWSMSMASTLTPEDEVFEGKFEDDDEVFEENPW